MKAVLGKILAVLARATLRRYKPTITAITGSVGKTSAKEAVFTMLESRFNVRRSEKNYNTEIGVPLTILGIPHHGRNIFKWLSAFIRVAIRVLIRDQNFPEILVLEMAADRPGDIEYLVKLAPPFIGVITAIGEIPVHVEFFSGPQAVAEEKSKLIQALPQQGMAVLNCDDSSVMEMKNRTPARLITYGFTGGADVRIASYELQFPEAQTIVYKFPRPQKKVDDAGALSGISFTLNYDGHTALIKLSNAFGKQQAYAAAAAAAVGLALGMALAEIAEALAGYESPPGRLKLLRGNKNTLILDDTYNASPSATAAALEVLVAFPARRRIAALGDMLELGEYTETAHRLAGKKAAAVADIFIGVGERMKFALDEARANCATETLWFATSREAGQALEAMLQPGDVVLVKGSQSIRMEKAVLEVMAEPQRAKELLVRQDSEWLKRL